MENAHDLPPSAGRPVRDGLQRLLYSGRARSIVVAVVGVGLAGCGLLAWPESAVLLESTPSGAQVLRNGQPVGQTPLRLTSRPAPLSGSVEVRLPGYRGWSGSLTSNLGETRLVQLDLEPLPGSVWVSSTPGGALATVDGRDAGRTPVVIPELTPGSHQVRLTLAEYQTWETAVDVEPGATLAEDVQLSPLPGPTTSPSALVDQPPVSAEPPSGDTVAELGQPAARAAEALVPAPLLLAQPIHPVAFMVENAPAARPQSGLDAADVVYEAMAEGGISRFMAIYVNGAPSVIGPVRSARHYFVNLAAEFGASLVHIGASPLGYDALRSSGLRNLDETYGQPGFWRSRARLAPHNAYTSIDGARQALDGRAAAADGGWAGLSFKDPAWRYQGPPAERLSVDFQPWDYRVEYRYESAANQYARFMDGTPHLDAETRAQLHAASVAVLTVTSWVIDAEGRLDMAQVGTGPAVYFVDGVAVEGAWSKPSPDEATHFLDGAGRAVRFNPGPVWLQIISPETKVSY